MMSATDVLQVLDALERSGVDTWLDGGWGVDALLGEQTREHDDLDLVIGHKDIDKAKEALAQIGYTDLDDHEFPCSFVLADPSDRSVDIHPVKWDQEGGGIQAQPNDAVWRYPPEGFNGQGTIEGRRCRCLTPEIQVLCHQGYELDETDRADMRLLRDRFGVILLPGQE